MLLFKILSISFFSLHFQSALELFYILNQGLFLELSECSCFKDPFGSFVLQRFDNCPVSSTELTMLPIGHKQENVMHQKKTNPKTIMTENFVEHKVNTDGNVKA